MSSVFAYYTAAVILLLVCPRAGFIQNGSYGLVMAPTVELLDNRNTYCPGETARIRCNISGNDSDVHVVYDWIIDGATYDPATFALPGHTVSRSDRYVLEVVQTTAYSANYSCSQRTVTMTIRSRAKLITFASK